VHRAREGFAACFERESITAARGGISEAPAYALGPVTAALVLTVQEEFEQNAARTPSVMQLIRQWGHRLRIKKTDLRIVSVFLLAILLLHLAYTLPRSHEANTRVAEAELNYKQGRFTDAMRICRSYPHHPLSLLLQANMWMLAEQPDQAVILYRQVLSQETESPSALFGLALALQMTGDFKQAQRRYVDFIDIYNARFPEAAALADDFIQFSRTEFAKPPHWKQVYTLPMMNDLGL